MTWSLLIEYWEQLESKQRSYLIILRNMTEKGTDSKLNMAIPVAGLSTQVARQDLSPTSKSTAMPVSFSD